MTTVYLYDPTTLEYQGEYVVPKGAFNDELFPAYYNPEAPPAYDVSTQQCLMQNGAWVVQAITESVPTLTQSQATQTAALSQACQVAIVGGFSSPALGTATTYPSTLIDQVNQHGATLAGDQLMCAQGGVWALRAHTAAQAAQVVADFISWRTQCQTQLATLTTQVNAATTAQTAQTIAWVNPT